MVSVFQKIITKFKLRPDLEGNAVYRLLKVIRACCYPLLIVTVITLGSVSIEEFATTDTSVMCDNGNHFFYSELGANNYWSSEDISIICLFAANNPNYKGFVSEAQAHYLSYEIIEYMEDKLGIEPNTQIPVNFSETKVRDPFKYIEGFGIALMSLALGAAAIEIVTRSLIYILFGKRNHKQNP